MAKLMCKSCGGKVKMAKGGMTSTKAIPKAQMGMNYGIPQTGTTNYSAPTMRRGGMTKKKYDDGGIFTPNGRLKSKKTRDIELSSYGSTGSVSKNKKNGETVTKTIKTSNGYAGTSADKIKTVTDKEGNVISNKEKSITPKAADRKINRVINNVGRNENDTYAYKKGGSTKATKFAALAPPYNKATFADRIVGAKMTKKRMGGVTKKK
jgi:hypothetical protein